MRHFLVSVLNSGFVCFSQEILPTPFLFKKVSISISVSAARLYVNICIPLYSIRFLAVGFLFFYQLLFFYISPTLFFLYFFFVVLTLCFLYNYISLYCMYLYFYLPLTLICYLHSTFPVISFCFYLSLCFCNRYIFLFIPICLSVAISLNIYLF